MKQIIRWALLCAALLLGTVAQAAEFPGTKVLFDSGKSAVPATSAGAVK